MEGVMDIFFRNVPRSTRGRDLYDFVAKGVKGWWPFAPDPGITRCDVLEITDMDTGKMEFHGLVTIRDPSLAEKAIKKLNGKIFMGSNIATVREYAHRTPGDRRVSGRYLGQGRPMDRRRSNLRIVERSKRLKSEMLDIKSDSKWARQHGSFSFD